MSRIDRRGLRLPVRPDRRRPESVWPTQICGSRSSTTTPRPGDEMVFGGGKSIRESMGQGLTTRDQGALDVVITNTVILDHWGIVRADVGIRDGRIVAIGKSGNPDIMDGVHPKLLIGPSTDVIAGEGKILTAGAIDTHVHFLSEVEMMEALATGTTTVAGGGTGPTEGSKATTVTPGAWSLTMMHRALDHIPLNVLLLGKGSTVSHEAMRQEALAGAGGFKVHEDWGSTPAAIDAALRAADEFGLQVALHADSLNETGYVQHTLDAIAGRGIHVFHAEGAGGGHAPDIIVTAGEPNVLPASTNPTLPHTVNTVAEHLDMLIVCHALNPRVPEDLAFAESRIRPTTIAAEDFLHDIGAISITSSDAQAMGRIGEVTLRTWQVAHVMKAQYGKLGTSMPADNERARRYVAKYTICPAVAHGIDHEIGSVEAGKMADLVLWDPAFFGVRPSAVIKGGAIVAAPLGDPNGCYPGPRSRCSFARPSRRLRDRPRTCPRRSSLRWPSRTVWPIVSVSPAPLPVFVRRDTSPRRTCRTTRRCRPSTSIRRRLPIKVNGDLIAPNPR